MRLQKFLSDAGVASRRAAEEMILDGRVLVNDEVVDSLPVFVDPDTDVVIADGVRVRRQAPRYFVVHKPKGVVCTNRDPSGRVRAVDLLPPQAGRLFVVGRLDADSSGLLLMTNDGELAERITHPRYGLAKVYRVQVRGQVAEDLPAKMRRGVYLAEGRAQASQVRVVHRARDRSSLEVTLREGRNRQVRRMLARLGHAVRELKRVQIGPLSLKGLPIGGARELSDAELAALRKAVQPGDAGGRDADGQAGAQRGHRGRGSRAARQGPHSGGIKQRPGRGAAPRGGRAKPQGAKPEHPQQRPRRRLIK